MIEREIITPDRDDTLRKMLAFWAEYNDLQKQRTALGGSEGRLQEIREIEQKLKDLDPERERLLKACHDAGISDKELEEAEGKM